MPCHSDTDALVAISERHQIKHGECRLGPALDRGTVLWRGGSDLPLGLFGTRAHPKGGAILAIWMRRLAWASLLCAMILMPMTFPGPYAP